ncbi:asparagine synthase-related protein [Schaalia sp. ZJ1691]|uniref:asparagine synthase-related protein n=1 Tax=Schaalia sp. ZJ1691 TaxID=2709404 RepID=UPI0013EDE1B1|nr:asparagine synthase-related protein [Schaalia sp. ZJ1691]
MILADEHKWTKFQFSFGDVWWRSSLPMSPHGTDFASPVEWARSQRGNWAAIITRDHEVHAITDGPRSFPILHTRINGELVLSSSPTDVLSLMDSPRRNTAAAEEFRHLGFVAGTDTLIEGVSTVPSGSCALFREDGTMTVTAHSTALCDSPIDVNPEEFHSHFFDVLREATARMVEQANGHQILIPLSGGADSRLILTLLREVGARNVLAFTYGVAGSSEAEISRLVATGLDYPWKYVQLDPHDVHARWYQPETLSFLQDSWSGNALPHIQDWYALKELADDPDIDPHAVISPGHTVVGNEHDFWAFPPEIPVSVGDMARILAHHHFVLQAAPDFPAHNAYSHAKLETFLREYWPDANPHQRASVITQYNLFERQAKYINNSVRAYEHYGFQWAMPMLEAEAWNTWFSCVPEVWGVDRAPYIRMVNERFAEVSGVSLPNFEAPAARLNPTMKELVKKSFDFMGVTKYLNRFYAAKVSRDHPMAFQALAGDLSTREIDRKLFSGTTILGIYCDLFLEGSWIPQGTVVPG